MKKKEKQFFITDFIKSITNFDYYKTIADNRLSKSIKYFFKLITIYVIVLIICTVFNINNGIKEFKDLINTEISSLNYSNGILSINNDENKTLFNKYVIIDTSKEDNSELENMSQIVIGKTYCSIKMDEYILRITYNDLYNEDINKDGIINALSNISIKYYLIVSLILFIWIFIIFAISTIMDILIIALIGYILAKIINRQFSFLQMFNISTHAITLSILLSIIYSVINTFSGFYIKYFSIMYTSIATIYMITAILLITAENNENDNIQ